MAGMGYEMGILIHIVTVAIVVSGFQLTVYSFPVPVPIVALGAFENLHFYRLSWA